MYLGKKVGCTFNFEDRKRSYSGYEVEVLDLIPSELGEQFAGDVEWFYADWFGYPRGIHYLAMKEYFVPEQRSENSRKGALSQVVNGETFFQRTSLEERAMRGIGFENFSSEQQAEYGRLGTIRATELGRTGLQQLANVEVTCPYCGKVGRGAAMKRWHFDNCSKVSQEENATCPYCGMIGRGSVMKRWHFDKCGSNPHV